MCKSLLSTFITLLFIFISTVQANQITYDSDELFYAEHLGFEIWHADTITYKELYNLFDHVVELIHPEILNEWKQLNTDARNASNIVNRSSAMVAIFNLAEFLGNDYFCFNDWSMIQWENAPWETNEWAPDNYWGDTLRFAYGFNDTYEEDGSNYGGNAYFYSMGRVSIRSEKSVFDQQKGSMRCADNLTSEEAIYAALRFYESGLSASERKPVNIDKLILSEIEKRKTEILETPTDISVSGEQYYVSVNGDDNNNGLSPDTPWKTLAKVTNTPLKSGDGVFFKRDDIWRGETLCIQAGVTYSAYGEGAKPAFYGSPENGASPDKWSLLDGTDNIWVYYQPIMDTGNIVFDDKLSAFKVAPYLEKGKFKMPDGSGNDFDVRLALIEDLMFYSEDYIFLAPNYNVYTTPKTSGRLFLRSDRGNPGDVFTSIEFCTWANTPSSNKGVIFAMDVPLRDMATIDNITVKYTGVYGINIGGSSITVQNCEIGWIGGCITDYVSHNEMVRFGNCIGSYGEIDDYRVLNNYLYQALDSGVSNEGNIMYVKHHKNIIYSGNLIENCVFGIEMFIENSNQNDKTSIENVLISDNIIANTGYGFGSDRQIRGWDSHAAIMMHGYYNDIYNMTIENNIFYRSKTYLLINLMDSNAEKALFSGNTYIQDNCGILCLWKIENEDGNKESNEYFNNDKSSNVIKSVIGDFAATVPNLSY